MFIDATSCSREAGRSLATRGDELKSNSGCTAKCERRVTAPDGNELFSHPPPDPKQAGAGGEMAFEDSLRSRSRRERHRDRPAVAMVQEIEGVFRIDCTIFCCFAVRAVSVCRNLLTPEATGTTRVTAKRLIMVIPWIAADGLRGVFRKPVIVLTHELEIPPVQDESRRPWSVVAGIWVLLLVGAWLVQKVMYLIIAVDPLSSFLTRGGVMRGLFKSISDGPCPI
jgi:hypothetical protein